jgi:hypothetical protein
MCRWIPLVVVAVATIGGCGESKLTSVGGTVTLDGQPLNEGSMRFVPSDGNAPTEAAMIKAGKFSTQLQRTSYKVEIHATKFIDTGVKLDEKGPGGGPTAVELLPARYHVNSELTLNITGPTSNARFDLKSR